MDNLGHNPGYNADAPIFEAPQPIMPNEQMMPTPERDFSQIGNAANAIFGTITESEPQQMAASPMPMQGVENANMEPIVQAGVPNNVVEANDADVINYGALRIKGDKFEGRAEVEKMTSKFERSGDPFSFVEEYNKGVADTLKNSYDRDLGKVN